MASFGRAESQFTDRQVTAAAITTVVVVHPGLIGTDDVLRIQFQVQAVTRNDPFQPGRFQVLFGLPVHLLGGKNPVPSSLPLPMMLV